MAGKIIHVRARNYFKIINSNGLELRFNLNCSTSLLHNKNPIFAAFKASDFEDIDIVFLTAWRV